MNLKKSIFNFHFCLEEEEKFVISAFSVNKEHPSKELQNLVNSDEFAKLVSSNENKYGVHDVSFNPEDELFGITSYEVEKDNIPDLMDSFKEFFINKGQEIADIVYLEVNYNEEEDEDSYDNCQEELDKKYNEYLDSFEVKGK